MALYHSYRFNGITINETLSIRSSYNGRNKAVHELTSIEYDYQTADYIYFLHYIFREMLTEHGYQQGKRRKPYT